MMGFKLERPDSAVAATVASGIHVTFTFDEPLDCAASSGPDVTIVPVPGTEASTLELDGNKLEISCQHNIIVARLSEAGKDSFMGEMANSANWPTEFQAALTITDLVGNQANFDELRLGTLYRSQQDGIASQLSNEGEVAAAAATKAAADKAVESNAATIKTKTELVEALDAQLASATSTKSAYSERFPAGASQPLVTMDLLGAATKGQGYGQDKPLNSVYSPRAKFCGHGTNNVYNPFWGVDLGSTVAVGKVTVYGHSMGGAWPSRQSNLNMWLGRSWASYNGNSNSNVASSLDVPRTSGLVVNLPANSVGQYLWITTSSGGLSLCTVKVERVITPAETVCEEIAQRASSVECAAASSCCEYVGGRCRPKATCDLVESATAKVSGLETEKSQASDALATEQIETTKLIAAQLVAADALASAQTAYAVSTANLAASSASAGAELSSSGESGAAVKSDDGDLYSLLVANFVILVLAVAAFVGREWYFARFGRPRTPTRPRRPSKVRVSPSSELQAPPQPTSMPPFAMRSPSSRLTLVGDATVTAI